MIGRPAAVVCAMLFVVECANRPPIATDGDDPQR